MARIVPKVSRDFVVPLGIANGAPAKRVLMLAALEFSRVAATLSLGIEALSESRVHKGNKDY